jgi:aminopeptidase N
VRYLLLLLTSICFAQQVKSVDFKACDASISVDFNERKVSGSCKYVFDVMSTIDTIKIDAVNMDFTNVMINGKTVKSKTAPKNLQLFEGYKKGKNTVTFDYSARPKQTMYFFGTSENKQVWTQGQGKNTSHWLPSFDDANEKVVFSLTIENDNSEEVISNGILKSKNEQGSMISWEYQMEKPMSSYLVMLAIGKFGKITEKSQSGIPLEYYFSAEDAAKAEPTYRNSKKIFDFLESEIGVKYPWQIYKQIPVKDFLYAGMENTSATVFAQDFIVDNIGHNDKDYLNVNAHELAHQWFGDMITAKSGKDHWLQEGFATYYALLAEREVYGDDYFNWKLYEIAEELQQAAKTDTIPILNEKASSLTYYKKGAWALHILRNAVGDDIFRKAVKKYLEKYGFKNVDTDEFLSEVGKVSRYDVDGFKKRWLEKSGFEVAEALLLLKDSKLMKQYLETGAMAKIAFPDKQAKFMDILKSDAYYPIKLEVLYQVENVPFEEKLSLLKAALQSNDLKVRQAVAQTVGKFPESFYADYAALLDDNSYITKEIALSTLWKLFPEKRAELLDRTKNNIGFNDRNLRIQWLTMALLEKGYEPADKVKFYDELIDYASPKYESSIRQNALTNLIFIGPNDKNTMRLLVNPLVHHKWQFSKFAREKIRELIKYIAPRNFYEKLLPELPEDERAQLKRLLGEKREGL